LGLVRGWTDKIAQVAGNLNPVAGPYFSISVPEPTGVVAVVAPQASSLLGLVSVIAPPLVTGNTVVVLTSRARPVPAVSLAEVLATSDVPPGVVNLLTAGSAGVADWLASHADVNALDLCGCDPVHAVDLEQAGAQTLKRVLRPPSSEPDWTAAPPGPHRILRFTETKTVWHPKGT
jgi:acyl-CoA reductase-like NAD-dependent aldehyde dehydrogenase